MVRRSIARRRSGSTYTILQLKTWCARYFAATCHLLLESGLLSLAVIPIYPCRPRYPAHSGGLCRWGEGTGMNMRRNATRCSDCDAAGHGRCAVQAVQRARMGLIQHTTRVTRACTNTYAFCARMCRCRRQPAPRWCRLSTPRQRHSKHGARFRVMNTHIMQCIP